MKARSAALMHKGMKTEPCLLVFRIKERIEQFLRVRNRIHWCKESMNEIDTRCLDWSREWFQWYVCRDRIGNS